MYIGDGIPLYCSWTPLFSRVPGRFSQQSQREDTNTAHDEEYDDDDGPCVRVDVREALELDEHKRVPDDHAELEHGPEYPGIARHGRLVGIQREVVALRSPNDGRAHAEHGGQGVERHRVWLIKLESRNAMHVPIRASSFKN